MDLQEPLMTCETLCDAGFTWNNCESPVARNSQVMNILAADAEACVKICSQGMILGWRQELFGNITTGFGLARDSVLPHEPR